MTLWNVRPYSALTCIRMSDRNRETPYSEEVYNIITGLRNPKTSGRDFRDVTAGIIDSGVKDRNVRRSNNKTKETNDKTQHYSFAILQS